VVIAHFTDIQAMYPNLKPVFYRQKVIEKFLKNCAQGGARFFGAAEMRATSRAAEAPGWKSGSD